MGIIYIEEQVVDMELQIAVKNHNKDMELNLVNYYGDLIKYIGFKNSRRKYK